MKLWKGLALSVMMLFLFQLTTAQTEGNWNMTESQVDSAMTLKGFSFLRSSWINGRFMKLYSGYTSMFGVQFDQVAYSWNRVTMPNGGIEALMFTHRLYSSADPAVVTLRDFLNRKYGYPDCEERTLTCEWKYAGKAAAILQFKDTYMTLYLVNPDAVGW
jgi:hypothetical protein